LGLPKQDCLDVTPVFYVVRIAAGSGVAAVQEPRTYDAHVRS